MAVHNYLLTECHVPRVFCFLFLFIVVVESSTDSECWNATCAQPQLECRYPKITVELPDLYNKCCNITECICEGTSYRLSSSHNYITQYRAIMWYTNCTWIDGNLEIVSIHQIEQTDILEATKHIRVVTGYVLIGKSQINYIDLSALRLIRGEKLYQEDRSVTESCQNIESQVGYALFVTDNYEKNKKGLGVREIRLSSLTEIMKGDVKIYDNRDLCFVDTIIWEREIFNSPDQKMIVTSNSNDCPRCPASCIHTGVDSNSHCWGNSSSFCQGFTRLPCRRCDDRCNSKGDCCHSYCAGGCIVEDRSMNQKRSCYACKELNDFGTCVQKCPTGIVGSHTAEIIKDETKIRYHLTFYCVAKCPSTRRTFLSDKLCLLTCPEDYFDNNGFCEQCPPGGCTNICYGLEAGIGKLKNDDIINSKNIGYFHKNCTIIEGSLYFRQSTFEGDTHCKTPGIENQSAFNVFENVEEITGYLDIEHWPYHDLCIFKNLKRIRGHRVRFMTYSLLVITDANNLRELCFNSLEEIQSGQVVVSYNPKLCFVKTVNWPQLFNSENLVSSITKNERKKNCVPCHDLCNENDGCWGPNSDQCVSCRYFTDYTDSNGKFPEQWIFDDELQANLPGHNITNCVRQCNNLKGVYVTKSRKCFPCDSQCNHTCIGPGPRNCTANFSVVDPLMSHGCKNVHFNGECIHECPQTHYANASYFCLPCSSGCIDGGCSGPEDIYGNNGCTACYKKSDEENQETIFRGQQCQICHTKLIEEECAHGCVHDSETDGFKCYTPPSSTYIIWIIIICGVLLLAIPTIIVLYKCRRTIRTMRKHIGDKIVGDTTQAEEFDMPITPSGTAPNRAQLRIVKESELALGKTLGSGAFGAVYRAVWTSMHIEGETIKIPVAVKKLKTFSHNNEIMDEAYVMASVDNPYLVRLLGICMTEQVSLITQLMPLGSLLEYVRDNIENIGSRHMLTWCTQIAKGMKYLEDKHLVHRDLAARNVLVKTPHHVKITDFGLAKMLNADQDVYFAEGGKLPIKWLAIECITERQFSHQSDVWAFGITCWEILTYGARPYEGIRAMEVLDILERGERLNQPPICTIDVYMLLVKCWMVDPLSRPRFCELVDEFSKMCREPIRYIVIKDDPNQGILSPNPEEERRFFERLVKEDNGNFDDELIVDEPDNYLLARNDLEEHLYENQSADQQGNQSVNCGASSSNHGTRAERLFSRKTPSSHPINSSNSENARTCGMRDSANADDVFVSCEQGKSMVVQLPDQEKGVEGGVHYRTQPAGAWAMTGRKDSEENPRYTEDPTLHRNSCIETSPLENGSRMLYDEDQYLLPTPSKKKPDYFDPTKHWTPETVPIPQGGPQSEFLGSLSNNAYIESTDSTSLLNNFEISQNRSPRMSNGPKPNYDPEYINTSENNLEYMNCQSPNSDVPRDDKHSQMVANSHAEKRKPNSITTFNNEEYMFTETDPNCSLPTQENGSHRIRNHSQPRSHQISSSSSLGNGSDASSSFSPSHILSNDERPLITRNAGGRHKPGKKLHTGVKDSPKDSDASVSLDNPEYMMLQNTVTSPLLVDNK